MPIRPHSRATVGRDASPGTDADDTGRFPRRCDRANMDLIPKQLTRPAVRLGAAAQNALEVARFGGLATDEEPSPYEVVERAARLPAAPLLPGRSDTPPGPPVLLVPPMMLAAEVYDVSPATSAVTILREHGVDPWVVDFGAPEKRGGGTRAHAHRPRARRVSDAVDRVARRDRAATSTSAVTRRAGCSATRPPPTGATRGSAR